MTDMLAASQIAVPAATAADLVAGLHRARPEEHEARFPTGFEPLDDVLSGGLRAQDLVVLGGRPGAGKTVASLQWARWMAMHGRTAIFVCYQHSRHALVRRLLAMELASVARPDEVAEVARLRAIAQEVVLGALPPEALTRHPLGEEAVQRIQEYGSRLHFVQGSGHATGTDRLAHIAAQHRDSSAALFVDYLQKIPTAEGTDEVARTRLVVEDLKELAMVLHIPVIAMSAVDREGLASAHVELHQLRGSADLAHDADVVILMNDKVAAPEPALERPAQPPHPIVIFSVEKNRDGARALELEFRKDFENFRFDPVGEFVTDSLPASSSEASGPSWNPASFRNSSSGG